MRVPRSLVLLVNTAYHLIWRMHNKEFRLWQNQNKRVYLKAVFEDMKNRVNNDEFVIYAYCIMSNHIHRMGKLLSKSDSLSDHLRRAHSSFGAKLNKCENRSGAVGEGRPMTKPIEDLVGEMNVMFYIFTNPVRAGICKDPKDVKLRKWSSCRFMAYGETTEFTEMLTLPEWYLSLGSTPKVRQAKFRSLLDAYLIENGLRRDPRMTQGLCIGSQEWADQVLQAAKNYWRAKQKKKRNLISKGFP